MIHIVSDWQDEHVHVMFAGLDIIFPWDTPAYNLVQLLIFLFENENEIVITTGDSYTGATSRRNTPQCSWESFAKATEYYGTTRYYINTLLATKGAFIDLPYNPVIKRNSTILNCNECFTALNFSAADAVMIRSLNSEGVEYRIRNTDTVSIFDAHILFGSVDNTEAVCLYIPKYAVTTAKLCELSYSTMFEHLGRKLCF